MCSESAQRDHEIGCTITPNSKITGRDLVFKGIVHPKINILSFPCVSFKTCIHLFLMQNTKLDILRNESVVCVHTMDVNGEPV